MGRSAAVATSPPASEHPHASSQGASPTEAYGFVGFILSGVAFALYLLWAYVPDDALRALGVACSPDKYWAVALPTWAGVALVYAAVAYESLCMLDVKRPEDVDGMEELSDAGAIPRRSRGDDPEVRARRGASRARVGTPPYRFSSRLVSRRPRVVASSHRDISPRPRLDSSLAPPGSRARDQGPASVRGVPGVISRARGAAARAAASGGGTSVTASSQSRSALGWAAGRGRR
ncbi:uncharacterized protein MICPUCDRAFT_58925 [Micromonas pusilla CCMP1545]|uniref:Predicted protein n=1 Tax=Micromonas pusilla (strain CCMP1545) TaxID=564608 RepID=C1MUT3_MICPC|nr:uncharacterized protein MICPUCDRAFT_58925 [Micromonas pusilla CCMP1545]EEH56380.1 predicted protein [Micromonas pusilla CCMP1545]|eukprot:XP_003059248.1 predicted protein [Micromonas pusilla CCMP1545]